jgi:hypothetical protein
MKRFILTLVLTVLAVSMAAAPSSETLTNADVVALVKAGLSPATITAKIAASPTAFTTDTDALVALAKNKVPDDVIQAMLHARNASPMTPPAPAPAVAMTSVVPEPAWTPTEAKRFEKDVWFSSSRRGGVYVLQEYPDDRGTVWCEGSLYLEEKELTAGPSGTGCPGVERFRLPWSRITAFCYHFDEIIPASDYGRRWPGTLRIETKDNHYLIGLYTRKQFDEVRSVLHEYRGNIPERCPDGAGVEILSRQAIAQFPITHQWIQYKPDKWHACQGPLTLNEQGLRFVQSTGSCPEQPTVPWDRVTRYCFEDGIWTGVQITFFGSKGEEWNFKAVYKENEISLRSLHEQLKLAKPTLLEKCE